MFYFAVLTQAPLPSSNLRASDWNTYKLGDLGQDA